MNALPPILIIIAALLTVFWEASFNGIRQILGAQIDLLPALVVYASLSTSIVTVATLAVIAGLSFDALSANPVGVTPLPLFMVGLLIHRQRDLILRDQPFAQFVLGLIASASVPVMTVLLLFTLGHAPIIGWGSLWQWIVMALGGAAATPVICQLFSFCNRALSYRHVTETSFRPDREIRRGRC